VVKILPPPWDLPGAIWRLTPSHQPVGALDPPAVTSVSDHCGVGPGARPVLGQVSPGGAGAQVGLGSSRSLAGFQSAAPAGPGGARRSAAARRGQKVASKVGTVSSVEATAMPLRCYCGALAPITVLRLNVWQVVLHLRGRSAGAVWGDLTLRRFNDWRALAGARSGALPSCGAHSRQSATPRARIDGKNRCSRRPT
jgi:hypothetical protein